MERKLWQLRKAHLWIQRVGPPTRGLFSFQSNPNGHFHQGPQDVLHPGPFSFQSNPNSHFPQGPQDAVHTAVKDSRCADICKAFCFASCQNTAQVGFHPCCHALFIFSGVGFHRCLRVASSNEFTLLPGQFVHVRFDKSRFG